MNNSEWVQSMGSRLVRRSLFANWSQISFLPHGMFTRMLNAREYMMNIAINSALEEIGATDRIVSY